MIEHDKLDEAQRFIREDLKEEKVRKLHEEVFLKKEGKMLDVEIGFEPCICSAGFLGNKECVESSWVRTRRL